MLRTPLCLLALSIAASGCGSPDVVGKESPSSTHDRPKADVGPVLEKVETLTLHTMPSDPIGENTDLTVWASGYAITDRIQSNVKLFDDQGKLIRTLGRLGDGPGEFRHPQSTVRLQNGDLLVVDAEARLSRFRSNGTFVERVQLPAFKIKELTLTEHDDRYLLSARVGGEDGQYFGLATVTSTGEQVASYHLLPELRQLYRGNFLDVRGVETQHYIVSHDVTTNDLHVYSKTTSQLRTRISIRAPWYVPPKWPTKPFASLVEITNWANDQMWGRVLESVYADKVLVGFVAAADEDTSEPRHYYALVDVRTGNQRIGDGPVDGIVRDVINSSAYMSRLDAEGTSLLEVYELQMSEVR